MKLNQSALSNSLYTLASPTTIVLYEGNQPSINDYVINFSTNYSLNGLNTLQVYDTSNEAFLNSQNVSNGLQFKKTSAPDITFPKQSIKSGTASWAVLFYDWIFVDQPSAINDSHFIIVPISDLSGLGILKLRSTTVTYSTASSDNLIADCIINIQLPASQIPTTTTTASPITTAAPADGTGDGGTDIGTGGGDGGTGADGTVGDGSAADGSGTGSGAADAAGADGAGAGGDGGAGDGGGGDGAGY